MLFRLSKKYVLVIGDRSAIGVRFSLINAYVLYKKYVCKRSINGSLCVFGGFEKIVTSCRII